VNHNNLKNTEIYTRVSQQDIRRIKSSLVFGNILKNLKEQGTVLRSYLSPLKLFICKAFKKWGL